MELLLTAMAEPIAKQLKKQKIPCDPAIAKEFQHFSDAISMLLFHNMLTENQYKDAKHKLYNKISAHVKTLK